jgi:hypothetical protein
MKGGDTETIASNEIRDRRSGINEIEGISLETHTSVEK